MLAPSNLSNDTMEMCILILLSFKIDVLSANFDLDVGALFNFVVSDLLVYLLMYLSFNVFILFFLFSHLIILRKKEYNQSS